MKCRIFEPQAFSFLLFCLCVGWLCRAGASPARQSVDNAALRESLVMITDPPQRVLLLQELSRRGDRESEQLAAILATSANSDVAAAAQRLLGMLATKSSIKTLLALPDTPRTADALLTAAGQVARRRGERQALPLYARVWGSTRASQELRLAALAGVLRGDPAQAAEVLPPLLADSGSAGSAYAAHLAALLPAGELKRLSKAKLEPTARRALLVSLAAVGNRDGAFLARAALEDEVNAEAAAAALGALGDASDVPALAALLEPGRPALAEAARKSLVALADPRADRAIANLFKIRMAPSNPAALLTVVAERRIAGMSELVAPYLQNGDGAIRTAALNALAAIGAVGEIDAVVACAAREREGEEARAIERALVHCAREFPEQTTAAITDASTPALLTALALASRPEGLAKLRAKLPGEEALRALANVWKRPDAIAPLFDAAESHSKTSLRIIALQGAIRLLPLTESPDDYSAFLEQARRLALRPEEQELLKALPLRAPGVWLSGINFLPRRISRWRSEACAVADFNGDGKLDIVAGPWLYLAPDWRAVRIREISSNIDEKGKGYADDFCNLILDVNRDGRPDIISGGWFNKTSYWFENPYGDSKATQEPELWQAHKIEELGNHETGTLVDIDGDGLAQEFLPDTHITVWYERGLDEDSKPTMLKHVVSTNKAVLGTGVGDINGDGRPDIIRPNAWYEAPADIRKGIWKEHPIALGGKDGTIDHTANIIVVDINRDGLNDILTSNSHKHGIFWYEQQRATDGTITWKQHLIDDTWSQPHYLAFADIDGDGSREIIVGKRFMAHNGGDPDEFGTLGVFYYKFTPGPAPVFRKYVISYGEDIGAGLNIVPVDIDGDGDIDLITTGKWGGPVLFENRMYEPIPAAERKAALEGGKR